MEDLDDEEGCNQEELMFDCFDYTTETSILATRKMMKNQSDIIIFLNNKMSRKTRNGIRNGILKQWKCLWCDNSWNAKPRDMEIHVIVPTVSKLLFVQIVLKPI